MNYITAKIVHWDVKVFVVSFSLFLSCFFCKQTYCDVRMLDWQMILALWFWLRDYSLISWWLSVIKAFWSYKFFVQVLCSILQHIDWNYDTAILNQQLRVVRYQCFIGISFFTNISTFKLFLKILRLVCDEAHWNQSFVKYIFLL